MQIEERSAGDVTILDLKGRMTLGDGDEILKDKVNSLVAQGAKTGPEPGGRSLHRQRWPGRNRADLYDSQQARREPQSS